MLLPFLLACAAASLPGDTATPPPPADAAWIRLDPTAAGTPTGHLVGWNLGRGTWYSPQDGPTHPEWRTPELVEAYARLAQVRAPGSEPYVRFSGLQIDGSAGEDGYHFYDYVAVDREVSEDDNVAVYEWMAIADELGGQALVTLNFGSGTAAEAADYVTYLESSDQQDPLVQARAHWGRAEPYDVAAYELGNESFAWWNTGWTDQGAYAYANPDSLNGGDPAWHGRPSSDAADYAARALDYVDAVLAVQPQARFWVPVAMANMEAWGGLDASIPALAPVLEHPAVQAAVIHHYQLDDALGLGLDGREDPLLMLSASALFAPGFAELREELARLERDEPLQLALTEYHLAGFFLSGSFEHGDRAIVGLGLADMLLAYARREVEHAAQHLAVNFSEDLDEALFSPWYNPFRLVEGEVRAMPSLYVSELVATHLRPRRLPVEWLQRPQVEVAGTYEADLVGIEAFAGDDELAFVLLNRDLEAPRTVRIELPAGWTPTSASLWAPESWDQDCLQEPVELRELAVVEGAGFLELELPPHSLAGIVAAP